MPDLIQPIIGFRSWHLVDGLLRSSGAGDAIWDPDVTVAECERGVDKLERYAYLGESHDAPAPGCGCGLYAYHAARVMGGDLNIRAALRAKLIITGKTPPDHDFISGAIAAWGRIEVHEEGFRAEKARIVALALDDRCLGEKGRADAIKAAARRYGAKAVPSYMLAEAGYEHGIACPEELRPKLEPEPEVGSSGLVALAPNGGTIAYYGPTNPAPERRRPARRAWRKFVNGLTGGKRA